MYKILKKKNIFVIRALANLTFGLTSKVGKNFYGRITVFHKSSTYNKQYRIIDYKRIITSEGCLLTLEKKKSHSGYLGVILFFLGLFTYILVPNDMQVGANYKGFSFRFFIKKNYSTFLGIMPVGNWVHHIELYPGLGGNLVRAAGTGGFIYSKWKNYVFIKLPSGRIIKLSKYNVCVNGLVSNKQHQLFVRRKAGYNRLMGIRPTVRGITMNPVDHPHGGGEGKKPKPVLQRTPWGKRANHFKTVKKKKNVKIPV